MDFRIAVVQPITLRRDQKNIADTIDFMHLFVVDSASSTREIYATTNTITSLQVRGQTGRAGTATAATWARGDVSAHP